MKDGGGTGEPRASGEAGLAGCPSSSAEIVRFRHEPKAANRDGEPVERTPTKRAGRAIKKHKNMSIIS